MQLRKGVEREIVLNVCRGAGKGAATILTLGTSVTLERPPKPNESLLALNILGCNTNV